MVSEASPIAGIAPHEPAAPGPCASGREASSRRPHGPSRRDIIVLVPAYGGGEPRPLQERSFMLATKNDAGRRDRVLADAARRAVHESRIGP
jgi:hypothetical protein